MKYRTNKDNIKDDEKMFPDTPSSSSSSSYSSSSLPPRGGPNSYSGDVPPFTLPPDGLFFPFFLSLFNLN